MSVTVWGRDATLFWHLDDRFLHSPRCDAQVGRWSFIQGSDRLFKVVARVPHIALFEGRDAKFEVDSRQQSVAFSKLASRLKLLDPIVVAPTQNEHITQSFLNTELQLRRTTRYSTRGNPKLLFGDFVSILIP